MPWPGITDFSEAVQNPQLCFAGTELENGVVAVNPRGMPLVYSGAFACVYPVSGRWAHVRGALFHARGERPAEALQRS